MGSRLGRGWRRKSGFTGSFEVIRGSWGPPSVRDQGQIDNVPGICGIQGCN
jgi:hypothetical protein